MKKKHLLWLFFLAIAFRLFFVVLWGPLAQPDSLAYENLAQNLLEGKGYVDTRPLQFVDASLVRTPGYPLFLAGIQALFPDQGLILILIQQFLGVMTVWLVYLMGERLMDEKTGFQAGLITAFHPWLAIYGNMVMTETLFIFMFTLSIFFLVMGIQKKSPGKFFQAGALFGLSVLVRPAFLLFPLLLPIGLFAIFKKTRLALRYSIFFGISCMLILTPLIIWNQAHKGYTGVTSFFGINLLTLVHPPPSFYRESDPFQKIVREYSKGDREVAPASIPSEIGRGLVFKQVTIPRTYMAVKSLREQGYSQIDIDRRFFGIARSYMMRYPFHYLRTAGKEMLKLWSGYPLEWLGGKFSRRLGQNRSDGDRFIWVTKIFARIGLGMALILLTAWGAWKMIRNHSVFLILLPIIASITLAFGFIAAFELRFRLPVEPFVILIIIYGIRRKPLRSGG